MPKLSEGTQFDPIYDCRKGTEDLQKYTTYSFVWGVYSFLMTPQSHFLCKNHFGLTVLRIVEIRGSHFFLLNFLSKIWSGLKPSKFQFQNSSSLYKTRKLVSRLLAKYILPIKPVALHSIFLAHAMQIKIMA